MSKGLGGLYDPNKKERDFEIIEMIKNGSTLKECSDTYGITQSRISVMLNEYGTSKVKLNKVFKTRMKNRSINSSLLKEKFFGKVQDKEIQRLFQEAIDEILPKNKLR